MKNSLAAIVVAILSSSAVSAPAGWTVTNLNPTGSTFSTTRAISQGQQVGYTIIGGKQRASLWSGTANSWVDLAPANAVSSAAYGVDGGYQTGQVVLNGVQRASLWNGTSASRIDLHPTGATQSNALAISGSQAAGYATIGGIDRAGVWSGSAGSWVDLSPAGATGSVAWATSGAQQAGYAWVGGIHRAALWNGSAASWVDLNPPGASESNVWGVSGGQQAGSVYIGGFQRASLWSGTAASWVDLNPVGSTQSAAFGLGEQRQVGYATFGGTYRAGLWQGTAASWVDLSAYLPPGFSYSIARGVERDAYNTYIAGYGFNTTTGQEEALFWTDLAFSDLGSGLAGTYGAPKLSGKGTLEPGSPGLLSLTSASEDKAAVLFVTPVSTPVPLMGGVLIAFGGPFTLVLNVTTDGNGNLSFPFTWPSGLPSATTFFMQYAIQDPAALQGISLSNAIKGVTP